MARVRRRERPPRHLISDEVADEIWVNSSHYHLPGHPEALFIEGDVHRSHAGFESPLLTRSKRITSLPGCSCRGSLFTAALLREGDGLDAIQAAAAACATSLTATAIRYAQCADEAAAVVGSSGRVVEYCFISDELMEMPGLTWIRKGEALPRESCTYRFNANADRVRRALRRDRAKRTPERTPDPGNTTPVTAKVLR